MRHEVQVEVLEELLAQIHEGRNADAGAVRACPASTWTCPERLALERRELFDSQPQLVGLSGDLAGPGSFLTTGDLGFPVLVVRGADGRVRAFVNACRHRGAIVETARRGDRALFSCPFHAWSYDTQGALKAVPMAEQFGPLQTARLGLAPLPAAEHCGMIFVHPQADGVIDAPALLEGLEDDFTAFGFADYRFALEDRLDLELNWKLVTDTFGETYHFKRLHKDTLAQTFEGDVLSYRTWRRNHRMVLGKQAIREMAERPKGGWRVTDGGFPVYFLFPNVVINVSEGAIAVVRSLPHATDPGRCTVQISYYRSHRGPEDMETFRQGFRDVVVNEDLAAAAGMQRNLASGRIDPVLFGRNEPPLHHYHHTFRTALGLGPLEAVG
jgi:phenylpropionate dioxygenase-like ring-hydroxylating dioxygenase large terminal subunit